jgi:hypothetical protein
MANCENKHTSEKDICVNCDKKIYQKNQFCVIKKGKSIEGYTIIDCPCKLINYCKELNKNFSVKHQFEYIREINLTHFYDMLPKYEEQKKLYREACQKKDKIRLEILDYKNKIVLLEKNLNLI